MRERTAAHSYVAVPYARVTKVYGKSLVDILHRGNSISGTFFCTSSAMEADVSRVYYRIGLKLTVGKYESETNTRSEFLGQKDLRKAYFSKTAACGNYTNAAYYVGRNAVAKGLFGSTVALGYGGIVRNRFPSVILNKAGKLLGKTRTEERV